MSPRCSSRGGVRKATSGAVAACRASLDRASAYISQAHKAGLWCDFATGEAGDLIDLWQHTTGLKFVEVLDRAREYLGMERPKENRDPNAPRDLQTTAEA